MTTPNPSGSPAETIAAGYATSEPAVVLGAVVVDGTASPSAQVKVPLSMLNRHGLVAGATGTGKTKTLQAMAEQLSAAGVPVFLADVKGDLSGIAAPGQPSERITRRAAEIGDEWTPAACPVQFLSLGDDGKGAPVRVTITSFGPQLLAKVLSLNEVQSSSLSLVFHYADGAGLPLLDLKDLRAVIQHLTSSAGSAELEQLGGLSKATAGVILRELIGFADTGADRFFGEPELDTAELLRTAEDGRGVVTVLELTGVQEQPALFSTFLMWMLADLFHDLPEVGDLGQAQAGLLLRRGPPAVRRCLEGVPRVGSADGAADPFQGRRRLLRLPVAHRRAARRARPARQPGAARAARVHARGREGARVDCVDLPPLAGVRP